MRALHKTCALSLAGSLALAACGEGIDLDQVEEDLDNPSGSTRDEDGVIAAREKMSGGSLDTAFASLGGLGFGSFGLTLQEPSIASLHPQRVALPFFRALLKKRAVGVRSFGQTNGGEPLPPEDVGSDEGISGCFEEALSSGSSTNIGPNGGSAEFDAEIDLADCTNLASGILEISGSAELDSESIEMDMQISYTDVCMKVGNNACLDGNVAMRMSASTTGQNAKILMGWNLTTSFDRPGASRQSLATKGGLRIAGSGLGGGSGSLEYLVYLRNKAGDEVSYVLKLAGNASGAGSLEIRGSDGKLSCTFSGDGSGSCTGNATHNWNQSDAKRVADDSTYRFYED